MMKNNAIVRTAYITLYTSISFHCDLSNAQNYMQTFDDEAINPRDYYDQAALVVLRSPWCHQCCVKIEMVRPIWCDVRFVYRNDVAICTQM